MKGHLRLTVAHDPAAGRSYVSRQSFRAPMHVGKGYWQDDALLVHAVNSTAGLFAEDVVEWEIDVDPGARLRLVSPSATRVHRAAREDTSAGLEPACTEQTFRVGKGGALEVWPELFIPHAGCRYRQATQIELEPGGELLFCESLAPGRVASGEAFAWESLRWALDIRYGGELVARERWQMQPGGSNPDPLQGWQNALGVPAPSYATVFFVSERIGETDPRWQQIHDLQAEDDGSPNPPLWIGVSRLRAAGWTIKMLARDGAVLRRTLANVRALLR